jgi:hypothetical protein
MPVDMPLTREALAIPAHSSAMTDSWWGEFRAALRRAVRSHSLLAAIVVLHMLAAIELPVILGVSNNYSIGSYVTVFTIVVAGFAVLFALIYPFYVALIIRPAQPGAYLGLQLREKLLSPKRIGNAIPVLIMVPVAMSSFTWLKVMIPIVNPFTWDIRLAEWDRALHGGFYPWQLLQPLLGVPIITSSVTFLYHLWIFVLCGVVLWQMLSTGNERRRMQYLVTLVLLWILVGNLAATVFSSAGPVYFGRVTGLPDPFAPLMDYLRYADRTTGVMALEVQELLWQSYLHQGAEIGRGISAMPSMHLASSFSFVLIGFATSRRLGILFGAFCLVILIGSVHLGWHYAIDGYVAIALTWIIWIMVGWLLNRPVVAATLWSQEAHSTVLAKTDLAPQRG